MTKIFNWNIEKNEQLKKERNISFENILTSISENKILDIIQHPNKDLYPNQKILIVEFNNYAYCVPFVENEKEIFLKTIFPDRKMKNKYLKNEK